MANRVYQINLRPVPAGTEVLGVTRTDRGTKYIAGSAIVFHKPGERKQHEAELLSVVEAILKGGI